MSNTKCNCLLVVWFHMIFVPKLSLDLVLIIYFRNGVQGNETDSRPSSRAGSPSKFRKISGGSLSRYSTKDECLLLRLIAFQLQLYLFWQIVIVRKSWKVLKCGAIQLQEWEYEQLGLEQRGGREGQEDPGAGGHPQEAEGAHGDFAGTCVDDLHDYQLISLWFPEKNAAVRRWRSAQISIPGVGWNSRPLKVSIVWRAGKVSKLWAKSCLLTFLICSIERVWFAAALFVDSWHLFNYMENWLEKWEVKITSKRSPRNISLTWLTVQRLPSKQE